MRLYDAHNHLQDDRLAPHLDAIMPALETAGVARMVVNGSCEGDWPQVLSLAKRNSRVVASFGYHPWYVHERTADWQRTLAHHLDAIPSAIGEIGLDQWIFEHPPLPRPSGSFSPSDGVRGRPLVPHTVALLPEQEEVFVWQLRLAAERNIPVSIHCLKAWGPLLQILRREPRPQCGFVLHSYSGSAEMVAPLARLGAYFSLPGHFAHERKHRQRETFFSVPPERLLIETDAPDQLLPDARNRHPLTESGTGKPLNHPANLAAVYEFAAELFGEPVEKLADRVEENFIRLFADVAC
jgi:TatD DNase family protein